MGVTLLNILNIYGLDLHGFLKKIRVVGSKIRLFVICNI